MAAGKHTFILQQGSTFDQLINLKDSAKDPVDLQDYDARMQIRSGFGGTLFANVSCSIVQTSGSSTFGTVRLQLAAANTDDLDFKEGLYDLEIFSGSVVPYVERILQGKIKLDKGITT